MSFVKEIFPSSPSYRTHTCGQLRICDVDADVTLSGWIHRKRDHGQLLFLDIRDHYGLTQCLVDRHHENFQQLETLPLESVVSLKGRVVARTPGTINSQLPTGDIEVVIQEVTVLSLSKSLPFSVNSREDFSEELRLKYRFLDLRRPHVHEAMLLRSQVIAFIRQAMITQGFLEIQTPILTATSPEGARDYVVPSRLYPGEFYALPQAPQQFKQLLMAAGFDRYFQIAPCFRDEASRADRSPGEFYQLDMEMAFVTQEDVWAAIEPVLYDTFCRFAPEGSSVTSMPFPKLTYEEAVRCYGSDKPDLRNPLVIQDWTECLDLQPFAPAMAKGAVVRGIRVPNADQMSRKDIKTLTEWAVQQGAPGLGYIIYGKEGQWQGPLAKFLQPHHQEALAKTLGEGDGIFFACDTDSGASKFLGKLRDLLGHQLNLMDPHAYAFCWITDFPMYEKDEETDSIIFSHNPFSMPQGGMEALCTQDPLSIKAYQYDIVCNGIELSSGAIRNHLPDVMYKAFEIAGYSRSHVEEQFGALLKAFQYGVPPHGGTAPGIDRIVMLLAGTANIREVIPFPLNQQARDSMMNAPCALPDTRLRELHLQVKE
jgi:aspartyl-tRNA synthetase